MKDLLSSSIDGPGGVDEEIKSHEAKKEPYAKAQSRPVTSKNYFSSFIWAFQVYTYIYSKTGIVNIH